MSDCPLGLPWFRSRPDRGVDVAVLAAGGAEDAGFAVGLGFGVGVGGDDPGVGEDLGRSAEGSVGVDEVAAVEEPVAGQRMTAS
jgi:hypothetical protein